MHSVDDVDGGVDMILQSGAQATQSASQSDTQRVERTEVSRS